MVKKHSNNPDQGNLFRGEIPLMPEGYYSGDKPNPNLQAFIETHLQEHPYDPETDDYNVPAFALPINTTKATGIYNLHTYSSKKPHDAIRQYIQHYTKPGDLVLDSFSGSGGTALAALMEGRKAIAIDRNPAATFITKNYCTPINVGELNLEFEKLKCKVKPEIDWLYETKCDRCDGKATTAYTVYSQVFQCSRCLKKVALFDCVEVEGQTAAGKPKKAKACPHCFLRGQTEIIRSQSKKFGSVPVLVSYLCTSGCNPKRSERQHNDSDPKKREFFEKYDLAKIAEIESEEIPYWYPKGYDVTGFSRYQRDALYYYGVKEIADFFTKRNLWAIAAIKAHINSNSFINFSLSAILLNSSRMYRHRAGGGGGPKGTDFMIPQIGREMPVWIQLEEKVNAALRGSDHFYTELLVSTQSACKLDVIFDNTIDYIFTDPPYAGNIQYGELSSIFVAWQGYSFSWHDEEIIINEVRGKTENDWANGMRQAMAECYRVLKPGRWLSLCYHDTSEGTWSLIQNIMTEVGFIVDRSDVTLFIDTGQKSYNQLTADKVNKRDLVINFRKPKPGELASTLTITGDEDETTFNEKVRVIIRNYLTTHPGEAKDRIYDEVVSRMVRAGLMEAHNFDELLSQVADEVREPLRKNLFEYEDLNLLGTHEISCWYLKETESGSEESERMIEKTTASKIEQFLIQQTSEELQKSQIQWINLKTREAEKRETLDTLPEDDPERRRSKLKREIKEIERQLQQLDAKRGEWRQQALHYSEIYEFYFFLKPKPKIALFALLEDYFFQTGQGNWRPPANDDERQQKEKLRNQASRRKMQSFCRRLETGDPIPQDQRPDNIMLVEWIRQCKRLELYEQGKLLYERGGLNLDDLPEEVMVNVEEDYQVCTRMLSRASEGGSKKGKGKKS